MGRPGAIFQYAMLAGGIMVVTGYVPVIVTNGVTRRAAADGGLAAVGGLAVAGALATTLGFVVEHLVYALYDWPHVLGGAQRACTSTTAPTSTGSILVELLALYATHAVAGMVIGAGLFRFGWAVGSPFLLAGVLWPWSASASWRAASSGCGSARARASTHLPSGSASRRPRPRGRRAMAARAG